jgi:hypothetical protein
MRDQGISSELDEAEVDAAILDLLTISPGLWTVEEVEREIGDGVAVADGLGRLYGSGLIHRLDGFVFASRAAAHGATL